ncbi:DUF6701 domain-containing protein [Idiomarina ramblicola]|uniref:Type II secretory pathway component n=1 Tax=Idiomarina ramblicola TaxID=263724 RepID=A0A432Z215_9GAMM|nr:DUF6701 domain-containing protein [Idiomarina ramblicola]RUO71944.1 Type II secretory pathway component [Idiomarina ramblicola]
MPVVLQCIAATLLVFASFPAMAANYNLPNNNLPGCSKSGNTYTCPNGLNLNYRDRIQIAGNNSVVINVNGNVNLGSEMRINENGAAQQLTIITTDSFNGRSQTAINANISSQQSITLANENAFSGSLVAGNSVSVGFRTDVDGSIRANNGSVTLQGENIITGDVNAGNDVIVRFLTEVNGNINAANGKVVLEGRNDVAGAIYSDGDTILRFRSNVDGAITSNSKVVLEGENTVDGNIIANDDVRLRYGADVNGDIESDGQVTLEGANIVDGNVNATDRVTIPNSSTVTGYVNSPQIIDESNVEGETCDINNNQGPCGNAPPDQTLDGLGYWTFDQSQWQGQSGEVLDSSGNGLHGDALRGADTSGFNAAMPGSPGTCRYGKFNGDNVVRVENASSIAEAESIAVAFWFKGSAARQNQSESYQTLLVMGNGPTEGSAGRFEVYRQDAGDGGGIYFEIRRNNGQIINVQAGNAQQGQANLLDDEWHHLAASYERGERRLTLYIDGQLADTTSFNGSRNLNSVMPRLHIGGQANSDNGFSGEIDEVFIDDKALNESDVAALKATTRPCNNQLPLCEAVWPIAFDAPNTVPQPFDLPDRSYNTQLPPQLQPIDYLRTGEFSDVGFNYTTNGQTSRVYIDGDLTIQSDRQINTGGDADELILIVTGDLILERNVEFRGYIYVSGDLYFERGSSYWQQTEIEGGLSVGGSRFGYGGSGQGPEVTYVNPQSPIDGGQFCTAEPAQPETPVLKWRMNSGPWSNSAGEIIDDSGNGLDGVAVNGASWRGAGAGSALEVNDANMGTCGYGYFDKSQQSYLEVTDSEQLDFTDEFTIGLWVKPVSYPDSGLMTILSKDENYEFHLNPDGTINWWWNLSDGSIREFNSNRVVPRNVWSYVAIRYRNGQQTMFINGAEAGTENYEGQLRTNQDNLQLGSDQTFAGRYFDGFLDELTIFDKALSDAQLTELQNQRVQCFNGTQDDYYRIEFNSPALTCTGAEITVKACSDDSCSELNNTPSTVELSVAGGADRWSNNPLQFIGQDVTQLQKYQAGTYSVEVSSSNPTGNSPPRCFINGEESENCLIQFADTGLLFTDGTNIANTAISKQISGQAYNGIYLQAIEKNSQTLACQAIVAPLSEVSMGMNCVDPGQCLMGAAINGTEVTESEGSEVDVSFDSGKAPLNVNYDDAGAITLSAEAELPNGKVLTGISQAFVWQPSSIGVEPSQNNSNNYYDNILAKAGERFTVTLSALNISGDITPNFGNEANAEKLQLLEQTQATADSPVAGVLTNADGFSKAGNGIFTNTELTYSEVGSTLVTAYIESGDYLSGYHTGEITLETDRKIERFIPFEFQLDVADGFINTCGVSDDGFYYIGQPQMLDAEGVSVTTLTALNKSGNTTRNYPTDEAEGELQFYPFNDVEGTKELLDGGQLTQSAVDLVWNEGEAVFASLNPTVTYNRDGAEEGPYKGYILGMQFNDNEADHYYSVIKGSLLPAAAPAPSYKTYGSTKLLYGRFVLDNIYGAEVDELPIAGRAEYWDGSFFIRNDSDSCSVLKPTDINVLSAKNLETGMNIAEPDMAEQPTSVSLVDGELVDADSLLSELLRFEEYGLQAEFTFELNVPGFLEYDWNDDDNYTNDPAAEGRFGIYGGRNRQIYWQEMGW